MMDSGCAVVLQMLLLRPATQHFSPLVFSILKYVDEQ